MKIVLVGAAAFALLCPNVAVTTASAQIKPAHSGKLSHGAPQMRRHGSGLYHPNRPFHHHHFGFAGYRPVHHRHHRHHEPY